MDISSLPLSIITGLRTLNDIPGLIITGTAEELPDEWVIPFSLDIEKSEEELIPLKTQWNVHISKDYPLGKIEVYPSVKGGITATFQHQTLNLIGNEGLSRSGKLCLDSPSESLNSLTVSSDPVGISEERLNWHIQRTISWLNAAASKNLAVENDPFELPYYPHRAGIKVVHIESDDTFPIWSTRLTGDIGTVQLCALSGIPETFHANGFFDQGDDLLYTSQRFLGDFLGKDAETFMGVWWFWKEPPIVAPWKPLLTWGELRQLAKNQGLDCVKKVEEIQELLRHQKRKVLLIGYPIPHKIGHLPVEVHWEAMEFPMPLATTKIPNGFRDNEIGRRERDKRTIFADSAKLYYLQTENWHPKRMQARGRLEDSLQNQKVALIGCGALGASMAELLIKGGVKNLLLIDPDLLEAGNLVRHTLTSADIGIKKVDALGRRLKTISPFCQITTHPENLPTNINQVEELLKNCTLILDCTGSNTVIYTLDQSKWSIPKLFVSLSVGYKARRSFLFMHKGFSLPAEEFHEKTYEILQEERKLSTQDEAVFQGAGCWSPLFPARFDDIMLAASTGLKTIESCISLKRAPKSELTVYEQLYDESGIFSGITQKVI